MKIKNNYKESIFRNSILFQNLCESDDVNDIESLMFIELKKFNLTHKEFNILNKYYKLIELKHNYFFREDGEVIVRHKWNPKQPKLLVDLLTKDISKINDIINCISYFNLEKSKDVLKFIADWYYFKDDKSYLRCIESGIIEELIMNIMDCELLIDWDLFHSINNFYNNFYYAWDHFKLETIKLNYELRKHIMDKDQPIPKRVKNIILLEKNNLFYNEIKYYINKGFEKIYQNDILLYDKENHDESITNIKMKTLEKLFRFIFPFELKKNDKIIKVDVKLNDFIEWIGINKTHDLLMKNNCFKFTENNNIMFCGLSQAIKIIFEIGFYINIEQFIKKIASVENLELKLKEKTYLYYYQNK